MGLSSAVTMMLMVTVSFAGPKINPKAFDLNPEMFKIKPQTTIMIVITLLIIFALYAKLWYTRVSKLTFNFMASQNCFIRVGVLINRKL